MFSEAGSFDGPALLAFMVFLSESLAVSPADDYPGAVSQMDAA